MKSPEGQNFIQSFVLSPLIATKPDQAETKTVSSISFLLLELSR